MRTPADVLTALVADDPGRPRITVYDDLAGERVELSAHVLANWVAKAGNALQDAWDVGPGSRVRLALPPHWRSAYWALATWAVGGCVVLPPSGADGDADEDGCAVVVTDDPRLAAAAGADGAGVLVTLAALARSAPGAVPPGVVDEARELATYADRLDPWEEPGPGDPALELGGEHVAYGQVVAYGQAAGAPADEPGARVHTATTDLGVFLRTCLAAWAAGGSVVLSRGTDDATRLPDRLRAEGVTVDLGNAV